MKLSFHYYIIERFILKNHLDWTELGVKEGCELLEFGGWAGQDFSPITSLEWLGNIRIEHSQDEDVELWDVHIGRYTITYTYDAIERPAFWLSDDGLTIRRWPSYRPRPRLTPDWA